MMPRCLDQLESAGGKGEAGGERCHVLLHARKAGDNFQLPFSSFPDYRNLVSRRRTRGQLYEGID